MNNIGGLNRTPWQIMRASLYALVIRNLEQQFVTTASNKRWRDLLRIFLEPFGHVILWTAVKLFRYQSQESGLSPELFILLGVIPWLFTLNTVTECVGVIGQNKALLFFRQVKPMDPVFALLISEFTSLALVFCCGLFLLTLLDVSWQLNDPLRWLMATALYVVFVIGLAMLLACTGFFAKRIAKFFRYSLRFMYLFSGIFFSAQMVSPSTRQFFLANPLFQYIEISRGCFSDSMNYSLFGDINYLFKCSLISIALGLGTYGVLRRKMMIEIMEH